MFQVRGPLSWKTHETMTTPAGVCCPTGVAMPPTGVALVASHIHHNHWYRGYNYSQYTFPPLQKNKTSSTQTPNPLTSFFKWQFRPQGSQCHQLGWQCHLQKSVNKNFSERAVVWEPAYWSCNTTNWPHSPTKKLTPPLKEIEFWIHSAFNTGQPTKKNKGFFSPATCGHHQQQVCQCHQLVCPLQEFQSQVSLYQCQSHGLEPMTKSSPRAPRCGVSNTWNMVKNGKKYAQKLSTACRSNTQWCCDSMRCPVRKVRKCI